MNKTVFKIIGQLKEKPFYLNLKEEEIKSQIENFKSKNKEPENAAERKLFKKEIELIKSDSSIKIDKIIEDFVNIEIEALHSIYTHRCLTYKQIYKMHFLKQFNNVQLFEKSIINEWIKLGVVKKIYFKHNNYVLFLTTRGVDILVNEYNFDNNVMNDKKQVVKRGYFRANELEMHPRLINHQIHLNQFVINFKRISNNFDKNFNSNIFSNIQYFDEKHMSKYKSIRPDGLISLFSTDFFIEMDMSTESKKQLIEKWNNYRNFLTNSEGEFDKKNKIIVLFIIENSKDLEYRINTVKETFSQTLIDKADSSNFEVYIGSSNQILEIVFNDILASIINQNQSKNKILNAIIEEDFLISFGYNVKDYFDNIEYDYYIRKIDENGKIKIENNRALEFLVLDYQNQPLSVINKIMYHKRNSSIFKTSLGRDVPLLIVVKSEKSIFNDLNLAEFDFDSNENVFFINNSDLNDEIIKNIYQIDNIGNLYKFRTYSLESKYFSKNIINNI